MNEQFFYDPERKEQERINEIKTAVWRSIRIKHIELPIGKCRAIFARELEKRGIEIPTRDMLAKLREELWKKP